MRLTQSPILFASLLSAFVWLAHVAEATTTNALRLFGIEEAAVVAGGGASRRAAERSA